MRAGIWLSATILGLANVISFPCPGSQLIQQPGGRLGSIEAVAPPSQESRDDPAEPTKSLLDFLLTIDGCRQYRLGRLEFVGNIRTRDKVVRSQMLILEGEVFNQTLWKQSLQNLYRLGLFEEIKPADVTFRPDALSGELNIELRLKEVEWEKSILFPSKLRCGLLDY